MSYCIAVFASSGDWLFGVNNSIPWDVKEDLKRFKDITMWEIVVMGKNTWYSLPEKVRPLPNRRNIVITSEKIDWVECYQLDEFLKLDISKYILIWWAKLLEEFFKRWLIDAVYHTRINEDRIKEYTEADTIKRIDMVWTQKLFIQNSIMTTYGFIDEYTKCSWADQIYGSVQTKWWESKYLGLLQKILDAWVDRMDRTGTGTRSVFGHQMRFDLSQGFPLLTTKKVFIKAIIHELIWFLSGDTNIRYLVQNDVKIWNEWAFAKYLKKTWKDTEIPRYSPEWDAEMWVFIEKIKTDESFALEWGDLWPVYGKQWRAWETKGGNLIDQMQNALNMIVNDPYSRRNIVSGWNVGEIEDLIRDKDTAPPPCHTLFQFYVADGKLSCQLYQRSADVFLGVPFNIASYALLTMMIAQVSGLEYGEFIHTFWDVHIYQNHMDQVREQLSRSPRSFPTMRINPEVKSLFDFKYEDFTLEWYDPHPSIKAPIAV